jgi:hypothetical protein
VIAFAGTGDSAKSTAVNNSFIEIIDSIYLKLFNVVQMIKPRREKCQEGETNPGTYDEKVYHRR